MAEINGTANADELIGTSSDDTISSFAGNDIIRTFTGDDVVDAGSGVDTIIVDHRGDQNRHHALINGGTEGAPGDGVDSADMFLSDTQSTGTSVLDFAGDNVFRMADGKIFEERWFVDTEAWKAAF